MKLIREEVLEAQFLIEEKDGKKTHYIQGIFMQAETKNKNGRVYPQAILDREADRYNRDYVSKNRAFGELGHPDTPAINLDRVSHLIVNLQKDRNNYVGKAKLMDTPNGTIVKNLLDGGAAVGVSTRGVGSLKPANGFQLVQDDYHLATAADIVADPSAPEAWVQGIMEGSEWILTPNGWQAVQMEKAQKLIREASRHDIERVTLKLFENFMQQLSK